REVRRTEAVIIETEIEVDLGRGNRSVVRHRDVEQSELGQRRSPGAVRHVDGNADAQVDLWRCGIDEAQRPRIRIEAHRDVDGGLDGSGEARLRIQTEGGAAKVQLGAGQ